ncbi:histidine phosphatase family protein [Mycobacterium paraterrae]|uniref:Phosphoglycerate mutase family protein n=1 Tax=Mycobacterium paraterrae TaxID=577492 RepID=A0ABY3VGI2_9MYCO|nr:histidine phosphatase family protein [Mycobacterium paraterrae]UMB68534.1 phosphoglycerate mutase family protein [Mycobacterium paraterrae]
MRNRTVIWKAVAVLAAVITVGACSSSPHVRSITLTFIRHAESEANVAKIIDSDIPGPDLTEEGRAQAEQLAHQLSRNSFDAVYASQMARTQQTAAPLAHALGKTVEILPGLNEINAGRYNHTPSKGACVQTDHDRWLDATCSPHLLAPADWLNGDVQDAIPGSVNGNQFNDQFTAAVQKIYDEGHAKPVAFSSRESIMYWTLMNVKNPKDSLVKTHPLSNVSRVVITGSPTLGWTLVDWDGIRDFSY